MLTSAAWIASSFFSAALLYGETAAGLHGKVPTVPQCRDVVMRAAYLAEEQPGQGPGFFLEIENHRSTPIAIAVPVPVGVDWYAETPHGWLWRASSGSGGSLTNALSAHGPLFAYQRDAAAARPTVHTVAAHATYSWSIFSKQSPAVRYRPGCEHCTYQGEDQFRAVVAYAYLPRADEAQELLRCGLRSTPVVMPRLPIDSHKP